MVELAKITQNNQQISDTFPDGITAVFVGATSGIGEYTLKALAKYAPNSTFYIVGRSQEAADRNIRECKEISPSCSLEFIKADISLINNVDNVCEQIKTKVKSINLLVQSQGSMAFETVTSEGLPQTVALGVHSRLRFIMGLLPLLENATGLRRVVCVGAGTCEGPIDLSNLHGTGFPLLKWRDQLASNVTLALEELSRRAPSVSMVHTVPGVVKSNISRDAQGFSLKLALVIGNIMSPFISTSPAEVAERTVFAATSAAFAPATLQTGESLGTPLIAGIADFPGSNARKGSGVYCLTDRSGVNPTKSVDQLHQHRQDGTATKAWEALLTELEKITGSSR